MYGLGGLLGLVAFVLVLVALSKISSLQTRLTQLRRQADTLTSEVDALKRQLLQGQTANAPAPSQTVSEDTGVEGAAISEAALAANPADVPGTPAPETKTVVAEVGAPAEDIGTGTAWGGKSAGAMRPPAAPRSSSDMEQTLASRWFVWIGGIAIAIGGLLFVKYAHDNGLFPPVLRMLAGITAGILLVGAGEWVRRKASRGLDIKSDYVPAALSAAGFAIVFAAIYAGYALYSLLQPMVAFAGLAATGIAALALSRLQGPLIAALGLVGSYVTPALIPSADPNAWGFFPYLLVILAASFAALRGRSWWWLGYAAVAGAGLWTALWIKGGVFEPADVVPTGLFALVIGVIAVFGIEGRRILAADSGDLHASGPVGQPLSIALFGLAVGASALALLVEHTGHGTPALILMSAGIAGVLLLAWVKPGVSILAPLAGLLFFAILISWRDAAFHAPTLDEGGRWTWSNAISPETNRFLNWMLASGAVLTLVGIAGATRHVAHVMWGALAAGAAVLFATGAWGRADFLLSEITWAIVSVCAAAALLAASTLSNRETEVSTAITGAGLMTAGSAVLAVFAADRLFDRVTLTLVIAALALGYAALTLWLRPRLLGPVAVALATLGALRLLVSREIWNDDRSLALGQHWVLYGYGVPALLTYTGSRLLHRTGHNRSAMALEGISLGLALSLVALELRVLINGGFTYENPEFLEMAAHFATWFAAAFGLMHRQRVFSSLIATWGARILLMMATCGAVLASLLGLNPVVTGDAVPGNMVLNALLLAYVVPAVFLAVIAMRLHLIGMEKLRSWALGISLMMAFAYVTLQTKRMFQGKLMQLESLSLAESYAYSAVWLIFALALFIAGIRLGRQYVRMAGLGVMALVVLKVFVADMSNLDGLYRIASFIGLGLCLVGIGWLYQRFVQTSKPQ